MAQVLRSSEARCGIEVLRTEDSVVMAVLAPDCSIDLKAHPMVWAEVGEQFKDGKRIFNFDEEWRPLFRHGPSGVEPYPVLEATRKFIRGCFSEPTGFKGGALDALIEVLPQGDVHLFIRAVGFVGRFAAVEDATMIAAALKVSRPIIFGSAEEIMGLPDPDLVEVVTWLEPEFQWPSEFQSHHAQGVFEMAKKAAKKKATKVAKAEATQRRADGPVAKAREKFDELYKANPDTPSSDYIAACDALKINRGTATTQLGRWRKEKGIAVKRGGARKKGDAKSAASNPSSDKPSSKKAKKGSKKKAEKKAAGLPAAPKGAKRHKPQAPKSEPAATTDKSSATPPSAAPNQSSPQTQPKPTPSSPGSSASAATAGASGATAASTSGAAGSPTAAGGEPPKK